MLRAPAHAGTLEWSWGEALKAVVLVTVMTVVTHVAAMAVILLIASPLAWEMVESEVQTELGGRHHLLGTLVPCCCDKVVFTFHPGNTKRPREAPLAIMYVHWISARVGGLCVPSLGECSGANSAGPGGLNGIALGTPGTP